MPLFRTPDGKIVEEKTKKVSASDTNLGADMDTEKLGLTEKDGQDSSVAGSNDFYDEKTRKMSGKMSETPARQPADDEKTQLFGSSRGKTEKNDVKSDVLDADDRSDGMQDPVVGWLVVVDGPGRGNALALGYGTNSIGRSEQDRVPLVFGDDQISRSRHAVVTFDPRGKKFYVQHGGGTNLTYLGDSPVLQPAELKDRNDISMGNTTLKFIALCGDDFDWHNE